jgi:diketogulonate reductase-like aldo/keto reductase
VVQRVAAAHGATPAQVLIRWSLDKGVITIPKSTKPARVRENCNVFELQLSVDDTAALDALHCDLRVTWDPTDVE